VDELAKSSVSEFLNLHNGIYLVNMSNWGIELKMKPQEVIENATVSGKSFIVTINTSKGPFQLMISDQPRNISIEQQSNS
jgi:CheY-specific phosphatase CheX